MDRAAVGRQLAHVCFAAALAAAAMADVQDLASSDEEPQRSADASAAAAAGARAGASALAGNSWEDDISATNSILSAIFYLEFVSIMK